ncbi:hypothetical protein DYB28_003797, partial [Aphanomyces astaci]
GGVALPLARGMDFLGGNVYDESTSVWPNDEPSCDDVTEPRRVVRRNPSRPLLGFTRRDMALALAYVWMNSLGEDGAVSVASGEAAELSGALEDEDVLARLARIGASCHRMHMETGVSISISNAAVRSSSSSRDDDVVETLDALSCEVTLELVRSMEHPRKLELREVVGERSAGCVC